MSFFQCVLGVGEWQSWRRNTGPDPEGLLILKTPELLKTSNLEVILALHSRKIILAALR